MNAPVRSKSLVPPLPHAVGDAFAPVRREFNRLLDEIGNGWDAFTDPRLAPIMDVIDGKDSVEIEMELPGLSRADVKIAVDGDVLTVSGEKKGQVERQDGHYRSIERRYGEFARSVYLPASVDAAHITAQMKDGVLIITAPKRPEAKTQTVEIRAA